ncbi:hypothetical protein IT417_00275 [bacterium]|nr:hypothetical protein [bacterium]
MARRRLDTPMVEKVQVVTQEPESENMLSMIVGTVLVALGILLFVVGVVMFVLYYLPPREDRNVTKPMLYELPGATNSVKLTIAGETDYDKVMIWVSDTVSQDEVTPVTVDVTDGRFSYDYLGTVDGTRYEIEAASLRGFPIRLRSEKTSPVFVLVDRTPPSKTVTFTYEREVDTKAFTVRGVAEASTTVTLRRDDKEYSAKTNDKGNFVIRDIPLSVGGNEFSAVVTDSAGNSSRATTNVKVIYALGDINGGGVTDLPESAGPLSNELAYILGNRLFGIFGIAALLILGTNLYIVSRKLKRVAV